MCNVSLHRRYSFRVDTRMYDHTTQSPLAHRPLQELKHNETVTLPINNSNRLVVTTSQRHNSPSKGDASRQAGAIPLPSFLSLSSPFTKPLLRTSITCGASNAKLSHTQNTHLSTIQCHQPHCNNKY